MPEPTGNAAFDEARAGGVVDTFLSFPDVKEAKAKVYDYIRRASLDKETQTMEMPAQYMFKDIPDEIGEADNRLDSIAETVAQMDAHNIAVGVIHMSDVTSSGRSRTSRGQCFAASAFRIPNCNGSALPRLTEDKNGN